MSRSDNIYSRITNRPKQNHFTIEIRRNIRNVIKCFLVFSMVLISISIIYKQKAKRSKYEMKTRANIARVCLNNIKTVISIGIRNK